jgi:hypothetical protein
MAAAGWVTRFRPRLSKGKHECVYQLARKGFELARVTWGLDGPYVPGEAKWRTRQVRDYGVVLHDLQVNAWVMAYRELVGDRVIDWLGPDQGRPPFKAAVGTPSSPRPGESRAARRAPSGGPRRPR